jgi:uncharacterized protein
MPVTPTYPGVYIEEIPSGVRTITGVSTSVTAFVGSARRGPIDRAVRILGFADFERRFGGLESDSELGYGVRQFFLNGGGEGYVIRLARNAVPAARTLGNGAADVLRLTARDAGRTGNDIEVRVDHATSNPASTFNLTLAYVSTGDPAAGRVERFENLTMNSRDPRYVVDVLREGSQLATAERLVDPATELAAVRGRSDSGALLDAGGNLIDVATLVDASHSRLQVAVDGAAPVEVVLNPATDVAGADAAARLATLCGAIQIQVSAVHAGFTCAPEPAGTPTGIRMVSGATGERSRVRVLGGSSNDVSARLRLGTAAGGTETDAVAQLRPVEMPDRAVLASSANITNSNLTGTPAAGEESLRVSLNGFGPDTVTLDYDLTGAGVLVERLGRIAENLQARVRALKATNPAYAGFTATVTGNNRLTVATGTRGAGSSIEVSAPPGDNLATILRLIGVGSRPPNTMLSGGNEEPYTAADAYNLFIGNRAQRRGIFALDGVDIFNLLCLPGVTDSGIIADAAAYCRERRAFLIVDPPRAATTPDAMGKLASGTALPKTDHAAIYFPWILTADPLAGGRPRLSAPSGTVAGAYARTDGTRGVWKAPAGTDATLVGVQGVDYVMTDQENGIINPRGVNAIRILPNIGPVAWGARTLRGDDQLADEYKYIPVRRLALFIEESLYRGTHWVVFEPNGETLWGQIRLNLEAFMQRLFRQGAFKGTSPREAYLVKCDAETTTREDINLGIVNILVGFAPLKPAEFVILRIQQLAGQSEA